MHCNREPLRELSRSLEIGGKCKYDEECIFFMGENRIEFVLLREKAGKRGSANANETLNERTKTKVWRDKSSRREYQILKCI